MSDHIKVRRIAVHAFHGVMAEEARLGQRFLISLDIEADLARAGRSDDLADTISYARLAEIAVAVATENRFQLLEALAEAIAAAILTEFPLALAASVEIEKPSAPIPAIFENAGLVITRRRGP